MYINCKTEDEKYEVLRYLQTKMVNMDIPNFKIFVAISDPNSSLGVSWVPAEYVEKSFC